MSKEINSKEYDYIIIGSGFGGSVSALRLAEKGYSVLVLEKGKRWNPDDFPRSNWNIRKYLWLPLFRMFGFQKLDFFREVFVLSGVGVGGGSLVYANTHMLPADDFYTHPGWARFNDWKSILEPYYALARRMLGSAKFEKEYEEDRILQDVAKDMGREQSYKPVDYVGVYFGSTSKPTDPYFNGHGPLRKGCSECAACMVGCRQGAKNTLDKNYLWLAEKLYGANIVPEREVMRIEQTMNGYEVETRSSTSFFSSRKITYRSKGIVVSAGVLGTLSLLFRQKMVYRTLPGLSDRLGENILTNSEMISGVLGADRKLNHGLAISRVFQPDDHTFVETVKFPDGSGMMARLGVMAAGPGSPIVRMSKMLANALLHPFDFIRTICTTDLSRKAIILLIMQRLPNSMKLQYVKGFVGWKLRFDNRTGGVPAYIAKGQEVLRRFAQKVNGVPHNAATEVFFNMSTTAHILGGCPMGENIQEGVVDPHFRIHGLQNAYILDGSIIPCNLGVNPSLTITTLAEYAMSKVPEKEGNKNFSLNYYLNSNQ